MSEFETMLRPIAAPSAETISAETISAADAIVVTTLQPEKYILTTMPWFVVTDKLTYHGPHVESNWVLKDHLIAGAFPAYETDDETYKSLTNILNSGVTDFVCLQAEYNTNSSRYGAVRHYMADIEYMLLHRDQFPKLTATITFADIYFHHFPIIDCQVEDDDKVWKFAKSVTQMVRKGKIIYLHCWGGHGRTGTVVCLVLYMLFHTSPTTIIGYCNAVHMCRSKAVNIGSPQTTVQTEQVIRLISIDISNPPLV